MGRNSFLGWNYIFQELFQEKGGNQLPLRWNWFLKIIAKYGRIFRWLHSSRTEYKNPHFGHNTRTGFPNEVEI
jgi:hypothetical protein